MTVCRLSLYFQVGWQLIRSFTSSLLAADKNEAINTQCADSNTDPNLFKSAYTNNIVHRLNNEPRQGAPYGALALRHLILGDVTTMEGVEAMMLSLIYCPKSRFFVDNSINFDRILSLKITIE